MARKQRGLSPSFILFLVGLVSGYLLAAIGEGVPLSKGTFIGAFLGSIVGLFIGTLNSLIAGDGEHTEGDNSD